MKICWWRRHRHVWGRWVDVDVVVYDDHGRATGQFTGQRRNCEECGKSQTREVW